MRFTPFPLALVFSLLTSCGGDDGPMTLGKACSTIAGPACERAIACNLGPNNNKQECVNAFVDACCKDNGTCDQMARDKDAEAALNDYVSRCSGAFPAWDCAQYAMGNPPPECRPPSSAAVAEPMSLPPTDVLEGPGFPRVREMGRAVGRARRMLAQ